MITPCILHIDDDDNDIFFLRTAFESAGVSNPLQVATDGQMAIDYLSGTGRFANRDQFPLPALIFLDLRVPKKSGFEVLAWIRQQPAFRTMVVIVFTSSLMPSDTERAYQCGANSVVSKPSDILQLTELVRHFKAWWLDCNRFAFPNEISPLSTL